MLLRQFDLTMNSRAFQRAIMVLLVSLALSACRPAYEFTVVQQDANSAILARSAIS
jgi:outer membrane protein assembly factor BamE (lipoprotein component of BamABCDE complex)